MITIIDLVSSELFGGNLWVTLFKYIFSFVVEGTDSYDEDDLTTISIDEYDSSTRRALPLFPSISTSFKLLNSHTPIRFHLP